MPKLLTLTPVRPPESLGRGYYRIILTPACDSVKLPEMKPGQFVEIKVPRPDVLLRRPISVCDADDSTLTLLVRAVGEGTRSLCEVLPGETVSVNGPLGHGFSLPADAGFSRPLLIGGGVGIAPMLLYARRLAEAGCRPALVYGGRNREELVALGDFEGCADVFPCTDDGSFGFHGLVTEHPAAVSGDYDFVACCGPKPMMKAVAALARRRGIACEVSLENMMACGIGACLCCVEKTVKGNVCVCTEGPVFNIENLTW